MKSPQKPATSTRPPGGGNVVSLTVHVNTLAKRRSKEFRDTIVHSAKEQHAEGNITGYILMYFDEGGDLAVDLELGENAPGPSLRAAADILQRMAVAGTPVVTSEEDDQQN